MVLGSPWGAGLPFSGEHRSQTPAEVCRDHGFTECRDLVGTDICRTRAVSRQGFSRDRGLQGTGVCRGQGFAEDRVLQGFSGAGVHRE